MTFVLIALGVVILMVMAKDQAPGNTTTRIGVIHPSPAPNTPTVNHVERLRNTDCG